METKPTKGPHLKREQQPKIPIFSFIARTSKWAQEAHKEHGNDWEGASHKQGQGTS